jgi:hypothetical protein
MVDEQIPIWQVIEEFKDKIKVQEVDIKDRREKLDAREEKLRSDEKILAEFHSKMEHRETSVSRREAELKQREELSDRKDKELFSMEGSLTNIEKQLRSERSVLEKRQTEISVQEAELLRLVESASSHERNIKESMRRFNEVEERLLLDETKLRQALEEASARREELLVKAKVLEEQAEAAANNKRFMIEQQKRFVEWERTLNDREKALNEKLVFFDSTGQHSFSVPASDDLMASTGPVPEEKNAEALEPTVDDGSQMRSVPAPMETMVETYVTPVPEPTPERTHVREPVRQEPQPKAEEVSCPQCRTIIDSTATTCWACGTNIKEAMMKMSVPEPEIAKPEPIVEPPAPVPASTTPPTDRSAEPEEDHRSSEVKKSVSIRKIIKRK